MCVTESRAGTESTSFAATPEKLHNLVLLLINLSPSSLKRSALFFIKFYPIVYQLGIGYNAKELVTGYSTFKPYELHNQRSRQE